MIVININEKYLIVQVLKYISFTKHKTPPWLVDKCYNKQVKFCNQFIIVLGLTMKQIVANQKVKIPEGLTVHVKSRLVTVKGPRGVLKRNFKHLAVDIRMMNPRLLKVEKWFGSKKELAAVRTVCSHVENMIKGKLFTSKSCNVFLV